MGQSKQAKIGVIGSAIAGLSSALAIANAGHKAVVFGTVPNQLAGALQLAPNGFSALAKLGALEALEPCMTRLHAIEIRAARHNKCLTMIDHDSPTRRDYAAIGRQSLANGLYQLAMAHPAISFVDKMVTTITCTQDETSCVTSDGIKYEFDLLIGADGQKGLARQKIAPAHADKEQFRIALRASCSAETLPQSFAARRTQLWLGDGYHLVGYPYHDSHNDKMMVNLVLCTMNSALEGHEIAKSLLGNNDILNALSAQDLRWHKTPLPPASQLATWRQNGLVLIGDGAHFMPPHLAQGAGQTLEDAATLQAALHDIGDVKSAASRWALGRQRALSSIIDKAESTGAVMRLSGPFARLRNAAVEFGGQRLIEKWLNQVWQ